MLRNQRIDHVSSPFAGHLHPQLDLAQQLRDRCELQIRFLSTPTARRAVELCDFPMVELLSNRSHIVTGIANAPRRVGSNPWRLLGQLRDNVSMMDQLVAELREQWTRDRPDLVIVDFAVPVAGLLAQSLGIPWWTSFTAVCAMETPDGVPGYLGGWRPKAGWVGRSRDLVGRSFVRTFKRCMHGLFRRQLKRLGIPRVYRADGYETIYSQEKILALRPREFEFPRAWPTWMEFIGPLTAGPPYPHRAPVFTEGKPHVLISLGTHVGWAKQSAEQLMRRVAQAMPDYEFHFSHGNATGDYGEDLQNFHVYAYFPYDQYAGRYAASINHVGTGVMFSCLRQGVPILAWPQDFDQFDHTARIVHHQLGLRLRPSVPHIVEDLRRLQTDAVIQSNVNNMQRIIASTNPADRVIELLDRQFAPTTSSGLPRSGQGDNVRK
ncbi:MAG: glycosyltransferase [Pirellulaceae bacterium]